MDSIQTNRLIIKPPELGDVEAIVALVNNWEVVKWLADVPYPYKESHGINYVEKSKHALETGSQYNCLIFLQDYLVGGTGLALQDNDIYELGYWIGEEHWGQGIATEASRAMLSFGFNELKQTRIEACYLDGNDASARVLKKLGFVNLGETMRFCKSHNREMKDYLMYLEPERFQNPSYNLQ